MEKKILQKSITRETFHFEFLYRRLNQHMEIPMTRNDLHQMPTDGKNASVSSTTTNTVVASNNSSIDMSAQQQQQHGFRRPAAYSHPVGANYSGEQRDLQSQTKVC